MGDRARGEADAGIPLGFWGALHRPFSVLAPMEDVTDTVFRRVVREAGAPDVFFTEFTSTDGLCSAGRPRVIARLRFTPEERPLVAQIWGMKPELYRRVASELREMGFDGLDINMGCPVRKIVSRGACGALVRTPSLAAELIAAAKEGAGDMPVSVKTRIGFAYSQVDEWLGFLLEQRIAALTVHGRTVAQQSNGQADWGAVALAVRIRSSLGVATLVIGNGDVRTPAEFIAAAGTSGADGVMIGRGVFENLFVFRAVRSTLAGRPDPEADFARLPPARKASYFRRHLALYQETWGERSRIDSVKKFAKTYLRAFEDSHRLVDAVLHARSYDEALGELDRWEASGATVHGARES